MDNRGVPPVSLSFHENFIVFGSVWQNSTGLGVFVTLFKRIFVSFCVWTKLLYIWAWFCNLEYVALFVQSPFPNSKLIPVKVLIFVFIMAWLILPEFLCEILPIQYGCHCCHFYYENNNLSFVWSNTPVLPINVVEIFVSCDINLYIGSCV